MHQPIFNAEQDMDAKSNVELMTAFKEAKIHLWFVSHNHSAQFTVSLYPGTKVGTATFAYAAGYLRAGAHDPRKTEPSTTPVKSSTVPPLETTATTGKNDPYYIADGTKKFKLNTSPAPKAAVEIDRVTFFKTNGLTKATKTATLKIHPDNAQFILQVLVGFSGRMNDPLFSDKFSDLVQMWAKSGFNAHGYVAAKFDGDNCFIDYYLTSQKEPYFSLKVVQDTTITNDNAVSTSFTTDFEAEIVDKQSTSRRRKSRKLKKRN